MTTLTSTLRETERGREKETERGPALKGLIQQHVDSLENSERTVQCGGVQYMLHSHVLDSGPKSIASE